MDALASILQEGETQVNTYKEGHLNRKTQAIGSGWQKCFYVLKEGQLYCYKGKKVDGARLSMQLATFANTTTTTGHASRSVVQRHAVHHSRRPQEEGSLRDRDARQEEAHRTAGRESGRARLMGQGHQQRHFRELERRLCDWIR